jgi:hypothetical protein
MTPREFVEDELRHIRNMWDVEKALNATCIFIKDDERAILPCMFRNDMEKEIYSAGIKVMVKETEPDVVVYWCEAWGLTARPEDIDNVPRPSTHKDRIEILMVQIEFKSGEKFGCSADIIRTNKEVKLSEFEVYDAADAMGRFVDFYPVRKKDKN